MIEINLARSLQRPVNPHEYSRLFCWLVGVVVFMGFGVASCWWTQSLQEQVDALVQEKIVKIQDLVQIKESLDKLQRFHEQKVLLMTSIEQLSDQEREKAWPVKMLDGVSRNVEKLDIWLERVQLESRVVELRGQSLALEDIGKFMEGLENDGIIVSLPVVEILDHPGGESDVFSFLIRFVWDQQVTT
ncbi:MAG: PilN domain-containing protein [Nitrospirales bacterium]